MSHRPASSSAFNYQHIFLEVDDPVAVITLNRPAVLNAWTDEMGDEVRHAVALVESDPAVVGIILTGAGRGFCAGADTRVLTSLSQSGGQLRRMPEQPPPGDPKWDEDLRGTYTYFLSVPKPVIGAINGPVAGLGLAIALACDLRFASETAIFTTAFAQRGLIAEWGISWLLTRLVGPSRALDLLYTGRKVEASEAATIGLVNRAVTAQDLLPVARAYVRDLAESSSPRSMSVMKRQVYTDLHVGLARAEALAADYMAESFVSPDFEEGVSSFLAHRPPRFGRLGSVVDGGS